MRKIKVLFKAPTLSNSGYGHHAQQLFKSLIEDPLFDVYCEHLRWGNTPFVTEDSFLISQAKECGKKYQIAQQQNDNRFDIFIHLTIPQEFERKGTFNIGVSAMVETDRVSHTWVQACQQMDLIIVPSEHSKNVICNTEVLWRNEQTKQEGKFKLTKPVLVCPEGVDTSIFHKLAEEELDKDFLAKLNIEPEFNFLSCGQWGNGGFNEDRKNIALLVKYFIETFPNQKDVGLVLKVNTGRNSVADYAQCIDRLNQIKSLFKPEMVPPIYLVHGNLSDKEMVTLYNHPKIKSFISLTHGEGWGLHLQEAAACELPIVATNWSGHLDFLNKGKFSAIEYDLVDIPDKAVWDGVLIKGSRWANVKEDDAKHRMRKMVNSYFTPTQWAKELGEKIKEEYDLSVTGKQFTDIIKMCIKNETVAPKISPLDALKEYIDTPENFNALYTMPQSTGDVFISTAVIDGLKKELPANAKIYFATSPQYFEVLKGNPNIHKVIPWNENMMSIDLLEEVFDVAFTPNVVTQYTYSNWIRRGQGRLLAEEFANHCNSQLGDYFIQEEEYGNAGFSKEYITFHPGSGKEQWEARNYLEWQELINNFKNLYPNIDIVQVGGKDEKKFEGTIDERGKTNVHQLATIIKNSKLHLSIDTFTMHLAAAYNTPLVALFGSSHATSTGPYYKDKKSSRAILLETQVKLGCSKACYKYQCQKNKDTPCINEIDPRQVLMACATFLGKNYGCTVEKFDDFKYQRIYGKISGYTTAYNCNKLGIPYVESIKSMLGFCDEVVVVDGCSDDGTYERLQELAVQDNRVKIYQNQFDMTEPGIDGCQKAFARALCENEFLWQMDLDEVVHEDDYEKIKLITKRFPATHDILHLPSIELFGSQGECTIRQNPWKWRLSRNKPEITHGIQKEARLVDEKTGKVYAKEGMSDGCFYINVMNNEMLSHTGYYNNQVELARIHMPELYAEGINEVFDRLPSTFHYSWYNIPNKIKQLTKGNIWCKLWELLYQKDCIDRFPGVETEEQIMQLAKHLYDQGGEDGDKLKGKFKLNRSQPAIMKEWIEKNKNVY